MYAGLTELLIPDPHSVDAPQVAVLRGSGQGEEASRPVATDDVRTVPRARRPEEHPVSSRAFPSEQSSHRRPRGERR